MVHAGQPYWHPGSVLTNLKRLSQESIFFPWHAWKPPLATSSGLLYLHDHVVDRELGSSPGKTGIPGLCCSPFLSSVPEPLRYQKHNTGAGWMMVHGTLQKKWSLLWINAYKMNIKCPAPCLFSQLCLCAELWAFITPQGGHQRLIAKKFCTDQV